jgi:LmbE family N-acetylglucosaminyl deacetylase
VRSRLLGIFAHPDDETFCAGGTFARYAELGTEIMVVSATRGEAGRIRDAAVGNRRTIAAVREAELRLACECLGITKVRCLDYVDGTLATPTSRPWWMRSPRSSASFGRTLSSLSVPTAATAIPTT